MDKQLVVHRDRARTPFEFFIVSCRGTDQQWAAAGAGALGTADLGVALTLLEEVAINSTIELPDLTQHWETDSWKAQIEPYVHQG